MYTSNQFKLRTEKPITIEEVIEDQIKKDKCTEFKRDAWDGVLYYRRKNTYINRIINERNQENQKNNNYWVSNHKCASGFLKKLIDQKVNYLLGKPVVIENTENCNDVFDINRILKKTSKEASKKGVEWLHPYIDSEGNFNLINICGLECIPVWDVEFENELQQMIRYYQITVINEKGEEVKRNKVELWDKEKVTYFMEDSEGHYYFDNELNLQGEYNPLYHYSNVTVVLGEEREIEVFGWGKVPFIPLWNNDDKVNDLEAIKPDIDLYDLTKSDFANNIDRFQEALMVIKNHNAKSHDELLDMIKKWGIIEVEDEGDVKWLQIDIPIEARKALIEIIVKDIYEFGMGVDTKSIGKDTTNITNIAIKSKYADLDLKCDDLESEVSTTIRESYWFFNRFLQINNKPTDDLSKMNIVYNRNIIFNNSEMIDNTLKSQGVTSDRTNLSNHPWVNDVDEELKQIEKENKNKPEDNTGNPLEKDVKKDE